MSKRYSIVRTWADGFGVWHAEVQDTEFEPRKRGGVVDPTAARGMRAAARRAIIGELCARGDFHPTITVKRDRDTEDLAGLNWNHSAYRHSRAIYSEV